MKEKARNADFGVHRIRRLRRFLSRDKLLKLTNALVLSHMDYSNSLFVNLPDSTIRPLQLVQNFAARNITGASQYSSATLALKETHMLPIKHRAMYKLGLIVFRALHGSAPSYLSELLIKQEPYRTRLRSQSVVTLRVPHTKKKTFADRGFSVAGPRFWNTLPVDTCQTESLDIFKSKLKSFLFKEHFLIE